MKQKHVCQYTLVRFMPYTETEEFVNVGLVLASPTAKFFGFRLLDNRWKRITQFFEHMDSKVYRRGIKAFGLELEQVRKHYIAESHFFDDPAAASSIFKEVISPRESLFRFSESRVVMSENPARHIDKLYEHYVQYGFVEKEYPEKRLERQLSDLLTRRNIKNRYRETTLGSQKYHFKVPFAWHGEDDSIYQAIKPLYLGQAEPTKIIEHGDIWTSRMRRLKQSSGQKPQQMLFVVTPPDHDNQRWEAYADIEDQLKRLGSKVISMSTGEKQVAETIMSAHSHAQIH